MTSANIIKLIKRFTDQYGVFVTWIEPEKIVNSRGVETFTQNNLMKTAKVLLLKDKFNPLQVINTGIIGLGQNYTRYILTLPEIEIKKDLVITDNHEMKWKLGVVDWFDIGGIPVCKQAALTEVS